MSSGVKLAVMGQQAPPVSIPALQASVGVGCPALPLVPAESVLPPADRRAPCPPGQVSPAAAASATGTSDSSSRSSSTSTGSTYRSSSTTGSTSGSFDLESGHATSTTSQRGGFGSTGSSSVSSADMRREASVPRSGWQHRLEQIGFDFYNLEARPTGPSRPATPFRRPRSTRWRQPARSLHGLA